MVYPSHIPMRANESDSECEGDSGDERAVLVGGQVASKLEAGALAKGRRRRRAIEDTDSDDDGVGAAGGPDGVRHQAAVAEARGHLGGGGKRGWVE